jgi:hypothetical protein
MEGKNHFNKVRSSIGMTDLYVLYDNDPAVKWATVIYFREKRVAALVTPCDVFLFSRLNKNILQVVATKVELESAGHFSVIERFKEDCVEALD